MYNKFYTESIFKFLSLIISVCVAIDSHVPVSATAFSGGFLIGLSNGIAEQQQQRDPGRIGQAWQGAAQSRVAVVAEAAGPPRFRAARGRRYHQPRASRGRTSCLDLGIFEFQFSLFNSESRNNCTPGRASEREKVPVGMVVRATTNQYLLKRVDYSVACSLVGRGV